MPCYHPITGYQTSGGDVVFVERGDITRSLFLPCGRCIGCRLERSRQWGVRMMHEASLYEENCVLTLTYAPKYLPEHGLLQYPDVQRFLKRLRKHWQIRYFACGEYGEADSRPHYHVAIFGYGFRSGRVKWKKSEAGFWQYRTKELDALWPIGLATVGDLSFEYAQYLAKYVLKKVNGDKAKAHYERVNEQTGEIYELVPEFAHMSLKPGIGAEWFMKYGAEVFPLDRVVTNGVPHKPPKYYDKLLALVSERFMVSKSWEHVAKEVRDDRVNRFDRADNTDERLAVKEVVAIAGSKLFRRK